MTNARALGLRVQIVLALAGLMVLAFFPLFFAVASLTRATLRSTREDGTRSLVRAISLHAEIAQASGGKDDVTRVLEAHAAHDGITAIAIFADDGSIVATAGEPRELSEMHAPARPYREAASMRHSSNERVLDFAEPLSSGAIVLRLRIDEDADRAASLVRVVALYMMTFALALMVFAYFALTRLIVQPIESLAQAADRVASGARELKVSRAGAREIAELGVSVQAMTKRLVDEERAMRAKVLELTRTTSSLTETRTQLAHSERLASVGRLAAGIAHEIGNPIAAIMGLEDLMLEGDLPSETQRDFLGRMRKETERIHIVLRDLLDFARPGSTTEASSEPANVREVIDDVTQLVAPQKTFREITILKEVEEDLRVQVPSSRLAQVLLNLVMNAGDALTTKGTRDARIVLRVKRAESKAQIEVEDNGPGIPMELRDRVFDPFVTTKDVGEGTGLGLAVCRGLVEAAGGEITLDASYEGGARFLVTLAIATS